MFEFGKYAPYIWPAFIATALGFAWMIADSLLRTRAWKRKAETAQMRRADD
ncbi:MAG: heme exporter protein CcmD [Caulobacterales bacterium 68-7]|nr:heme exporter protein CcmD [Caulobacterales bacterium]OJU10380.1 MAG: heme exporter protein CcmD [Caulobacterales bacterium 68-7]